MFEERARRRWSGIAFVLACMCVLAGCSVTVAGTPTVDQSATGPQSSRPTTSSRVTTRTTAPVPAGSGFVDSKNRFAMVPPTGWTVDTSGSQGTAVVFLDPAPTSSPAGPFSSNINVLVVPAGADLPAVVVGARQELQGLNKYASTADEPVMLSDRTPAHMLGGTFTDAASGFELRNLQLFTVSNGSTVVVTATALATAWGRYESVFDTSLRTLTVTA